MQYFQYSDPRTGEKIDSHVTGWRKIHVTNSEHPYMSQWWVPGCTIGYEHTFINALADFLQGLETGKPVQPDFRSGLRTQKVCDARLSSRLRGFGAGKLCRRQPVRNGTQRRIPSFSMIFW